MTAYTHGSIDVAGLILVIAAVLAICGGLYRIWVRDLVVGAVLLIAGIVVLSFAL